MQLPFEARKQEVFVKKEAETSDKFGVEPEKRSCENLIEYGIVNIDKPAGPTSHQVSAYVKQILKIKKAGHTGTLDPMVTGVLPVSLGRATRISHALLKAGKEYVCLMHLHQNIPESKINSAISEFQGEIAQLPPVRSAIKRQVRNRTIYYIDVLEIIGRDVLFKVGSQAGTYIRKLVHDIGQRLGIGAHMAELRRTKAGPFNESALHTLQDLKDAYHIWKKEGDGGLFKKIVYPVEKGVEHLPKIWVMDTTVDALCHGASLKIPGISKLNQIKNGELVAAMTLKNELIMTGIAHATSKEIVKKHKGLAVKPQQVFMQPNIYPKVERI